MNSKLQPFQIKQLIFGGENQTIDFKKTITSCEKISRTMVSFANNKGGRLLIGIADDGSIKGVKNEDEEKYMIEKAANQFCKPFLEPKFEEIYVDEKLILVVNIEESDMKPHYALSEDKKWWVYIRVKDKSILASKIVVDVLQHNYNEPVVIQYGENEKTLLTYLSQYNKITLKEFSKLIKHPRKRAAKILVNFILAGIIKVNSTEQEEFYQAI